MTWSNRANARPRAAPDLRRGLLLAESEASNLGNGIIGPIKELAMEYTVEMNRLNELQLEGSIG